MLKKTITYTDYNGEKRTEDFYFNLSKAEISEMSMSINGGLPNYLLEILQKKDSSETIKWFKDFILKAYGEKSLDGKYFKKSKEISDNFACTEAYSELFMELLAPGNEEEAAKFFNGVMPELTEKEKAQAKANMGEYISTYNLNVNKQ